MVFVNYIVVFVEISKKNYVIVMVSVSYVVVFMKLCCCFY